MPKPSPEQIAERSRKRITEIRAELAGMDYVCSGTLLRRMNLKTAVKSVGERQGAVSMVL